MDYKLGLDSNRNPIVGSKWMYQEYGPLLVEGILPDSKIKCQNQGKGDNPWMGTLGLFQAGESHGYKLLEVPGGNVELNPQKSILKKGIDNEGKPIIGSVWESAGEEWPVATFRIDRINPGSQNADLSKRQPDGTFGKGGHAWSWSKIALKWKLLSIPDSEVIPILVIQEHRSLDYELSMRECEKRGDFMTARDYAQNAVAYKKVDYLMQLEETAVAEKRVIRADKLQKMDVGDRKLWEMKGLKPFSAYINQMQGWLWYE